MTVCPYCNGFVDCAGVHDLGWRECTTCKKQLTLIMLSSVCYCVPTQDFQIFVSNLASQRGISDDALTKILVTKIRKLDFLVGLEFSLDLELQKSPSTKFLVRLQDILSM